VLVAVFGLAGDAHTGFAAVKRLHALALASLSSTSAHFVANTPVSPWFVNTVNGARLLFTWNRLERISFALLAAIFGRGEVAFPLASPQALFTRDRACAILGPFAPATINNALDLDWSCWAGVHFFGGRVLALEKRFFIAFANDVSDEELFGSGSAGRHAGGAGVAHLTAHHVSSGLVKGFAADGFEVAGFWVEDLDLSLAKG